MGLLLDLTTASDSRVYILFWSVWLYMILSSKLCSRCSLLLNLVCDSRWIWNLIYHPKHLKCNSHFCEDLIEESRLLCCCNSATRFKLHDICTCSCMLTIALIKYKLGLELLSSMFIVLCYHLWIECCCVINVASLRSYKHKIVNSRLSNYL
jgi:hypothetical protein